MTVGARIAALLEGSTVLVEHEAGLVAFVRGRLVSAGLSFIEEHPFDRNNRVDFFVENCAVELKVAGSWASVYRQLDRYLGFENVAEALLVTTKLAHMRVPTSARGKRIRVAWLGGAGL